MRSDSDCRRFEDASTRKSGTLASACGGAECLRYTSPSRPVRLCDSPHIGSVCRRSSRPGRDLRTSVRRKRFAGDASVSLQPKRPGRKTDFRSREKRSTRFSIRFDPSLVSPQRFNAPPQVLAGHARRQLPSRLARARAVSPGRAGKVKVDRLVSIGHFSGAGRGSCGRQETNCDLFHLYPDQVFVQDCAVCCRPATVTVRVDAEGTVSVAVEP